MNVGVGEVVSASLRRVLDTSSLESSGEELDVGVLVGGNSVEEKTEWEGQIRVREFTAPNKLTAEGRCRRQGIRQR